MDSLHPLAAYRDRQDPKMSQADLGRLLGVTRVTVHRWESGARKIDPELVASISQKTGIPGRLLRPDLASMMEPAE
jgi:transcriptional regulator with XRE-family HTH domain